VLELQQICYECFDAFQDLTKKNVMLLPIGACDDMAHSQNEKINLANYLNGIKTFIAYLLELKHIEKCIL